MTYNDQTVHHAATMAEAAMQIALEEMQRGRTDQAVEHLRLALDQLTAALDGEEWTIWDTIDSGKRGFDTFLDEINEAKTPTFAYWFDGLFSGKITAGTPELGAYLGGRSEEHTSELQSRENLLCRFLLDKNNTRTYQTS